MHGGTNPGAPLGNRNARKHGNRSAEATAQLKLVRQMDRDLRLLGKVRDGIPLKTQDWDRLIQLYWQNQYDDSPADSPSD